MNVPRPPPLSTADKAVLALCGVVLLWQILIELADTILVRQGVLP